jgi:hypothetical protein
LIDPTTIPQIPIDVTNLSNGSVAPTGLNEIYLLYTILNDIQPSLGYSWVLTYPPDLAQIFILPYIQTVVPRNQLLQSEIATSAAAIVQAAGSLAEGNPIPAITSVLTATGTISPLVVPIAQALKQYLSVQNTANGGSTSTVQYPAGSPATSITTTYAGPNGTGGLATEDQENPNGTSQITTYTSNSFTETTYSGPNGTGSVTGSVVDNGNSGTGDD